MVSGAIQEKEPRPPLHLGVVANEKGALGSPSTIVANLYRCKCECVSIYACMCNLREINTYNYKLFPFVYDLS